MLGVKAAAIHVNQNHKQLVVCATTQTQKSCLPCHGVLPSQRSWTHYEKFEWKPSSRIHLFLSLQKKCMAL